MGERLDTRELVVGDEVLPMASDGPVFKHYTGKVLAIVDQAVTVRWEVGGEERRDRSTLWRCPRNVVLPSGPRVVDRTTPRALTISEAFPYQASWKVKD